MARILVGTASWSDPGFVEYWYPKKMPAADRLAWYAQHFDMVELNSSFYSVPDPGMVRRWRESTPANFVFNVKLHQLLSHHSTPAKFLPPAVVKKLHLDKSAKVARTPEVEREMIAAFTPALEVLQRADKLGVLLLQLSPAFSARKHELDELEHVLELTRKFRVAVELRNRNWAEGEQLERSIEFFHEWNAIFVNVDAPRENHFTIMPTDIDAITNSDVAYLRLHGRNAKGYLTGKTVAARFNYNYSDAEIAEVAERTQTLARRAKEVHVVFNNNARDYAPHAALRLRKALGQLVALPPQTGELF
ncbi:MAG: hypothetical protein DME86_02825 [Verrucomicrobia bacterium]|nr:MAG: hypothetical protein DME86_02825 [Verrucomicrobiota bacterium]